MKLLRHISFFLAACLCMLGAGSLAAQCLIGTQKISGAGCGCQNGCNLTVWGGPNCGSPGVSTNCAYQFNSTTVTIPSGCTFRVEAYMDLWPGCPQSGADAAPVPGDRMKVEGSVAKAFQVGASNSSPYDFVQQTGGSVTVQSWVNRADEIVYWVATDLTPGGCSGCASILLPLELTEFSYTLSTDSLYFFWTTATERNTDYFTIEGSADNAAYTSIYQVDAAGNSNAATHYSCAIARRSDMNYFRLIATDENGNFSLMPTIISVNDAHASVADIYCANGQLILSGESKDRQAVILELFDLSGRRIFLETIANDGQLYKVYTVNHTGLVLAVLKNSDGKIITQKKVLITE